MLQSIKNEGGKRAEVHQNRQSQQDKNWADPLAEENCVTGDQQQKGKDQIKRERTPFVDASHKITDRQQEGPEQRGAAVGKSFQGYSPKSVPREVFGHRHVNIGIVQHVNEMPVILPD